MTSTFKPWIATYTGKKFTFAHPTPDQIDIEDIAHALSNLCRYGGHARIFYSVCEHSVHVSKAVLTHEQSITAGAANVHNALWALLHDASEAYLVDVPRPIKRQLSNYEQMEDDILRCVAMKFDLSWPIPDVVKHYDNCILIDEMACLMPPGLAEGSEYTAGLKRIGIHNFGLSPGQAKNRFLEMFSLFSALYRRS